tara:strand:+ start:741 stop:1319 length:579 start_codon:yes stop_codon:yes gene_type:complete
MPDQVQTKIHWFLKNKSDETDDDETVYYETCKICKEKQSSKPWLWGECQGFDYLNEKGECDICRNCSDQIKYLEKDYIPGRKDGIKYIRGKRCKNCNFKLCKINEKIHCWVCWCSKRGPSGVLGDSGRPISKLNQYPKNTINVGKYSGKMFAFILQEDYSYCKWLITQPHYKGTKLKNLIDDLESDTFGESN